MRMSVEGSEVLPFNALVAEGSRSKVQENFFLPVEVKEVIDPLIERHGRKQKWMFYVAAILALLEKGDEGIGDRIGQVASAKHTGGIGKLLKAVAKMRVVPIEGTTNGGQLVDFIEAGEKSTQLVPTPADPAETPAGKTRKGKPAAGLARAPRKPRARKRATNNLSNGPAPAAALLPR